MKLKKILSAMIMGAFIFSVSASSVDVASAASISDVKDAKTKYDRAKDKIDDLKNGTSRTGDKDKPPEPPKDENGNPLPPPDKKDGDNDKRDGDNYNRREPPKDENGNSLPPRDKKDKTELDKAKDKYDETKKDIDKTKRDIERLRK